MEILDLLKERNVEVNHGFGGVTFTESQVSDAAGQINHSIHWTMIAFMIFVIALSMIAGGYAVRKLF